MKDYALINWVSIEEADQRHIARSEFFLITQNDQLLYFGVGFRQFIDREIWDTIRRHGFNTREIDIHLGQVQDCTATRITNRTIGEIAKNFVSHYAPMRNSGGDRLPETEMQISNVGCDLVQEDLMQVV